MINNSVHGVIYTVVDRGVKSGGGLPSGCMMMT